MFDVRQTNGWERKRERLLVKAHIVDMLGKRTAITLHLF